MGIVNGWNTGFLKFLKNSDFSIVLKIFEKFGMYKVCCLYKVPPPEWQLRGTLSSQNTKLYTDALTLKEIVGW